MALDSAEDEKNRLIALLMTRLPPLDRNHIANELSHILLELGDDPNHSFAAYLKIHEGNTLLAAKAYYRTELQHSLENRIIKTDKGDVKITSTGWHEFKNWLKRDFIKAALVSKIKEILVNGFSSDWEPNYHGKSEYFTDFCVFTDIVDLFGITIKADVIVGKSKDGNLFYEVDHEFSPLWVKRKGTLDDTGFKPHFDFGASSEGKPSLDNIADIEHGINMHIEAAWDTEGNPIPLDKLNDYVAEQLQDSEGKILDATAGFITDVLDYTKEITKEKALSLVEGKTEKPTGVNPSMFFQPESDNPNRKDRYFYGNVPIAFFRTNEAGDRYDPTVDQSRADEYSKRDTDDIPPVLARLRLSTRTEDHIAITDGGHRLSAARMRGDRTIPAIITVDSKDLPLLDTPKFDFIVELEFELSIASPLDKLKIAKDIRNGQYSLFDAVKPFRATREILNEGVRRSKKIVDEFNKTGKLPSYS